MDIRDPDATPRVLRVINVGLDGIESVSSHRSSDKARRFGLRSISGSLSSIWSRDSTSRTRSGLSQDQASHGCSSFSTFLTTHHAISQRAQRDLLIKSENTPLPALRCVSAAKPPPCTPNPRRPTIQKRQFKKPPATPPTRLKASRTHLGLLTQIRSNVMASTSSSTMSSSSGDESVNGGPAGNNGTRGSFGAETAANDVAGTSVFPNGDYLNRVLSRLSARQHDVSSGRTSRNSGDTAATSFDEVLASRVGPIAYHPVGSPNPLRAPQPSLASVLSRQTSPSTEETPLPAIAAVKIDTFTTTSFGQNPKFSATAHAIFNVTAVPQNACMADESDASSNLPLPPYRLMDNYPGYLTDLEFQTFISGPGTKLVEMGPPTRESLHLGDSWVTVVHLGVKETSLASRLSISVRSKGNSSAARSMEKSASMSLIDQWLDVLKMDNRKKNEPVVVTAVIKYRHAFMPADTWLKTRTSCTPDMTGKNIAEAEIRTARKGKAKAHDSADPPPYMVLNGDPLQRTLLAGMVVRVLDPGDDSLRLHSLRGVVGPSQPAVRAVDALRLLQEVRESFGYGHDHLINIDLVALQNYYQDTLTKETHTTEATAIARSVRRHAQTMVKKLSPQKLAKKPSVSCVPTPSTAASAAPAPTAPTAPTASVTASAAPQVARNEPREDVAGHESGTGVGSGSASGRAVVRQRTIWEEGEDFYAQIIEGQPGTPRPDLPL